MSPEEDCRDALAERLYRNGRQIAFNISLVTIRAVNAALVAVGFEISKADFLDICGTAYDTESATIEGQAAEYVDKHRNLLPVPGEEEEEI